MFHHLPLVTLVTVSHIKQVNCRYRAHPLISSPQLRLLTLIGSKTFMVLTIKIKLAVFKLKVSSIASETYNNLNKQTLILRNYNYFKAI